MIPPTASNEPTFVNRTTTVSPDSTAAGVFSGAFTGAFSRAASTATSVFSSFCAACRAASVRAFVPAEMNSACSPEPTTFAADRISPSFTLTSRSDSVACTGYRFSTGVPVDFTATALPNST